MWPLPSYQTGVAGGLSSQQFRNVPDVGSSMRIPILLPMRSMRRRLGRGIWAEQARRLLLWAAFTALLNQQSLSAGNGTLGFANPTLYQLDSSSTYVRQIFNDVTSGNNGHFSAGAGYDNTTGWGSYKGNLLIDAVERHPGSTASSLEKPVERLPFPQSLGYPEIRLPSRDLGQRSG